MRQLPQQSPRVETGAVQFGDDWPGLFIRGDNAFALRMAIRDIEYSLPKDSPAWLSLIQLKGIAGIVDADVIVGPARSSIADQIESGAAEPR